jgi:hypothetical protein
MSAIRDVFRKITTKKHKYSSEEDFKNEDGSPMSAPQIMRLSVDDIPSYIIDIERPRVFGGDNLKRTALERLVAIKGNKKILEEQGKPPKEIQQVLYNRQYADVMYIDQQYIAQEQSKRDHQAYYLKASEYARTNTQRPATEREIDTLVSQSMREVMRQHIEEKQLRNRLNRLRNRPEEAFTREEQQYMTNEEIADILPSAPKTTATQRGKGKKTRRGRKPPVRMNKSRVARRKKQNKSRKSAYA